MVSSMLLPFPLPQTTSPRPLRCSELCAVCGDQSTGYHYEVPSCNGCKTFFRRTIVSERVFKCHKNGNCIFNKDVRCACRSCRFKKCLEVGMNPRAIQNSRTGCNTATTPSTSASKETSPSTTPELKQKRAFDVCSLLDLPPSSSISPPPDLAFFSKISSAELTSRLADLLTLEEKVDSLRMSPHSPPTILLDILTRPSALLEPKSTILITAPLIDIEKEMFAVLEYVKAFNWFCQFNFSDKFALLCERTTALLALRLAWNRAGSAFQDQYSLLLAPLVESMRRLNVDKGSLCLLSALLLSENCSFSLSASAKEELAKEKDINAACLASYLFQKHGVSGAAQVAQHFSLLWTALLAAEKLKENLKMTQSEHSLCRQLVDNTGSF